MTESKKNMFRNKELESIFQRESNTEFIFNSFLIHSILRHLICIFEKLKLNMLMIRASAEFQLTNK